MPKVVIAEVDRTSAEAPQYNDYVVLLPGHSPNLVNGQEDLFYTTAKFHEVAGEYSSADPKPISYRIAEYLLDLGMTILWVEVDDPTTLESSDFWEKYQDKGQYDLRFIFSPEYRSQTTAQYMIKCAGVRGDAVALVDIPDPAESGEDEFDLDYINHFIESLTVSDIVISGHDNENPFKYAACFSQNVSFKGEDAELPGSFAYLSAFAKHINRFPAWFAMAGSIRGVLPFEKVSTSYKFSTAEIDNLQDRETADKKAVNVITEVRPYGNIIWGNRTLYPLTRGDDGSLGLRASNFLNIRQLCCDLKKLLFRVSRQYTFEPNSDVLWTNFKNSITPLLEEMKSGQGIRGYKIVKVATTKKATLKAKIIIIPIEAVEDFDLTVELSDSISVTEEE